MADVESKLDKKVEYGVLSSFYGALLTERQRSMLTLYCDEDLSLAEVAKQLHVTRQCVNDTLQRAFQRLDELESSLCLMARFERHREVMAVCRDLIKLSRNGVDAVYNLDQAAKRLDDYLREEDA